MKVLITGATGFVGRYIVRAATTNGHEVTCLARHLPDDVDAFPDVHWAVGDVARFESLGDSFAGQDAVIHLVGIIEEKKSSGITFERVHTEGTRNVVRKATESGVTTFLQMSANGARENGVSRYQTSKWKAERIVESAGFDHWAIFRPTVIFGNPAPGTPEFGSQIVADLLRPFPIWPVFGDGSYEMQPVHVRDVASAFASALTLPSTHTRTYCVAGIERMTYRELLGRLASGAGIREKTIVPVPLPLVSPAVRLFGGWLLPITYDQLVMLVEGNTCDPTDFLADFGLEPVAFESDTLAYLKGS